MMRFKAIDANDDDDDDDSVMRYGRDLCDRKIKHTPKMNKTVYKLLNDEVSQRVR